MAAGIIPTMPQPPLYTIIFKGHYTSERLQMWQSGTLSSLSHTSLSVQVSNVYVAENRPVKPGDALEEAGRSPRNALTNSN